MTNLTTTGFILKTVGAYDLAGKVLEAGYAKDRKEAVKLINSTVIADGTVEQDKGEWVKPGMVRQYKLTSSGRNVLNLK